MGTFFHIGQEFTLIKANVEGAGAAFEALADINGEGAGYALVLFMPGVTEGEIRSFHSGRVNVRIIRETNSFALSLFRFSDDLIFEASFDPTLYPDNRAMQLVLESNLLYIFIVDPADNNRLKAMRAGSFPKMLRSKLISAWSNAAEQPGFTAKYQKWIHDLWKRYSTKQLWKNADYAGWIGD